MKVLKKHEDLVKQVRLSNYKLFFDVDTKEDYEILKENLI